MAVDPEALDGRLAHGPLLRIEAVRAHAEAAALEFDHVLENGGRRHASSPRTARTAPRSVGVKPITSRSAPAVTNSSRCNGFSVQARSADVPGRSSPSSPLSLRAEMDLPAQRPNSAPAPRPKRPQTTA